jgi:hypothetical protein
MLKRILLLVLLGAAFFWVAADLLKERYRKGDIYPPLCSLSAAPQGGRAFYEGLHRSGTVAVARAFRPIDKVAPPGEAAYFYLGMEGNVEWTQDQVDSMEAFMNRGGRLVLAFQGNQFTPWGWEDGGNMGSRIRNWRERWKTKPIPGADGPANQSPPKTSPTKKEAASHAFPEGNGAPLIVLMERWGFGTKRDGAGAAALKAAAKPATAGSEPDQDSTQPEIPRVSRIAVPDLEESLVWEHGTDLILENPSQWKVAYGWALATPVVVERPFGSGSLVVMANSYSVSNEALARNRAPRFLLWLLGGKSTAIFDEASRGVEESPSFGTLARKYGLGWLGFMFLVLAGLFVWRQASSLVPADSNGRDDQAHVTLGRDASAGFQSLLRQALPVRQLLHHCVAEWRRSFHRVGDPGGRIAEFERIAAVELAVPDLRPGILTAYARLTQAADPRAKRPVRTAVKPSNPVTPTPTPRV